MPKAAGEASADHLGAITEGRDRRLRPLKPLGGLCRTESRDGRRGGHWLLCDDTTRFPFLSPSQPSGPGLTLPNLYPRGSTHPAEAGDVSHRGPLVESPHRLIAPHRLRLSSRASRLGFVDSSAETAARSAQPPIAIASLYWPGDGIWRRLLPAARGRLPPALLPRCRRVGAGTCGGWWMVDGGWQLWAPSQPGRRAQGRPETSTSLAPSWRCHRWASPRRTPLGLADKKP